MKFSDKIKKQNAEKHLLSKVDKDKLKYCQSLLQKANAIGVNRWFQGKVCDDSFPSGYRDVPQRNYEYSYTHNAYILYILDKDLFFSIGEIDENDCQIFVFNLINLTKLSQKELNTIYWDFD